MVIDALLVVAKITAGLLFSSGTIIADGLHSASDLITDIAVLAGLRVADQPADRCHHYGHRRVSTLVAMLVGAVLVLAAGWIAYSGIRSLREGVGAARPVVPLLVAAASVIVKELLFRLTRQVGRRSGNISLLANAWHHRTDAFTSLAAVAGLSGVAIGGSDWALLDPITAVVLAAFVAVMAVKIMKTSASELIDKAPGASILNKIERAVMETRGVRSYHAFRARTVGGKVAMDIHVQVAPDLTVLKGHEIASAVKRSVFSAAPNVVEIVVHVEPAHVE